jgi:hypothetical protein
MPGSPIKIFRRMVAAISPVSRRCCTDLLGSRRADHGLDHAVIAYDSGLPNSSI